MVLIVDTVCVLCCSDVDTEDEDDWVLGATPLNRPWVTSSVRYPYQSILLLYSASAIRGSEM